MESVSQFQRYEHAYKLLSNEFVVLKVISLNFDSKNIFSIKIIF